MSKTTEPLSYICAFHTAEEDYIEFLEMIKSRLDLKFQSVNEVDLWRDFGGFCDIRFDEQTRVEIVVSPLFQIEFANCVLMISRIRTWKQFFQERFGKSSQPASAWKLSDLREPINSALRRCGVERVLWCIDRNGDVTNPDCWKELPHETKV
ncbi:MAG: hypothetical protein U0903_04780 [Planctomycetales bacterium]